MSFIYINMLVGCGMVGIDMNVIFVVVIKCIEVLCDGVVV